MRDQILKTASSNLGKAHAIIEKTQIYKAWESIGAKVNLIGSVKMGLMVKHRDIDFHIYTSELDVSQSFTAISIIASNPAIKRVEYRNLSDTEEECIEWHAWYEDQEGLQCQLDMIHIKSGSAFDGMMEKVSDRIMETITPEQREIIMELKYQTSEGFNVFGIQYYVAVMRDGVKNFGEFQQWMEQHPAEGIFMWVP